MNFFWFRRDFLLCFIFSGATLCGASVGGADAPPLEYFDHEYEFAFQFPADWKTQKNPPPGDAGEVRAFIKHPTKPMYVMAIVGDVGRSITRRKFEANPNRSAIVNAMIEWTIQGVYKKSSREIGAERMIVSEKRVVPSDGGIKFYISTAHMKGKLLWLVAGIHILPYEKPYLVTFIMVTPVDKTANKDNEIITKVFNSFYVRGEKILP